jgi:hypothetical protein
MSDLMGATPSVAVQIRNIVTTQPSLKARSVTENQFKQLGAGLSQPSRAHESTKLKVGCLH